MLSTTIVDTCRHFVDTCRHFSEDMLDTFKVLSKTCSTLSKCWANMLNTFKVLSNVSSLIFVNINAFVVQAQSSRTSWVHWHHEDGCEVAWVRQALEILISSECAALKEIYVVYIWMYVRTFFCFEGWGSTSQTGASAVASLVVGSFCRLQRMIPRPCG